MQNNSLYARIDRLDACLVRRDEVMSLLSSGQMIKAIKVYREDTGASLSDAKIAVERIEQRVRLGLLSSPMQVSPGPVAPVEPYDTGSWRTEVQHMLHQQLRIQAIKVYREHTGVGLREAITAVDQMAEELPVGSEPHPFEAPPVAAYPSEEVRRLLMERKKIQAIKVYREQTGVGLREAKNAVDQMEKELHVGSEPRPFEVPPVAAYPNEEVRRPFMEGRLMQVIKIRRKQNWR